MLSPAALVLLSYVLLTTGLVFSNGHFSPPALTFVIFSFVTFIMAFVRYRHGGRDRTPLITSLAVVLLFLLFLNATSDPLLHATTPLFAFFWTIACYIVAGGLLAVFFLLPQRSPRAEYCVIVAAAILSILFQCLIPRASPRPVIDTFVNIQESAQHLLQGKNPLITPVSDVYQGKASFRTWTKGYAYLPGNLYLHTLAFAFTGDARALSIVASLIVAMVLFFFARTVIGASAAGLLSLVFLFHPRGMFVIEQSWIDPTVLLFFALSLFAFGRKRMALGAALLGYMISLKQYLVFFFIHFTLLHRSLRSTLIICCVALATLLPFAILSFGALWQNVMGTAVIFSFRPDGLTLASLLYRMTGITTPAAWSVVVGILVSSWTFWILRRDRSLAAYIFSAALTLMSIFLLGAQAFCNYYYLVSGMMLFLIPLLVGTQFPAPAHISSEKSV